MFRDDRLTGNEIRYTENPKCKAKSAKFKYKTYFLN